MGKRFISECPLKTGVTEMKQWGSSSTRHLIVLSFLDKVPKLTLESQPKVKKPSLTLPVPIPDEERKLT